MVDEVLVSKALTIDRCVARVRAQLALSDSFLTDVDRQDIAVLNIQRACEAAIDVALRLIRSRTLGAPTSNAEAFDMLVSADLISPDQAAALKRMVGFRSIAVHQYRELDPAIIEQVIVRSLDDLLTFAAIALRL